MHPHHVTAIILGLAVGGLFGYLYADTTLVTLPVFAQLKTTLNPGVAVNVNSLVSGTQNAVSGLLADFGLNSSSSTA